jgi:prepilin-type N-terminal cleavage/methylation domain-containing protein
MGRFFRDQRGLSLAELLVVTAVVGLVLAGVFMIQQKGQQAYLMGSNRVETQQNARVALDLMVRELRSANAVTALGGAGDVTALVDHDNDPGTADIPVRYQLAGTTLNRIVNGVATPLIGGVEGLTMTYYSVYPTETNDASAVRVIGIELRTRTEEAAAAGTPGDQRARMESFVALRNYLM